MTRFYRKVFKIRADDSPNVRYALAEVASGKAPSHRVILPGVVTYHEYLKRRATWDRVKQCVGLDGEFYEGAENLLYPPQWLNLAERFWEDLKRRGVTRKAKAAGVDPAEGGDQTALAAVDEYGLIELLSLKTPDTNIIVGMVRSFIERHGILANRVMIDRGGGGKQLADRLIAQGLKVRTVGFGESVAPELRRRLTLLEEKRDEQAERYRYKNRRAEMYGDLSVMLEPDEFGNVHFALPPGTEGSEYIELRRQLAPIPKWYDEEGRLYLPPKQRKPSDTKSSDKVTMQSLLGCSPDAADALVLAVFGMSERNRRPRAGA